MGVVNYATKLKQERDTLLDVCKALNYALECADTENLLNASGELRCYLREVINQIEKDE